MGIEVGSGEVFRRGRLDARLYGLRVCCCKIAVVAREKAYVRAERAVQWGGLVSLQQQSHMPLYPGGECQFQYADMRTAAGHRAAQTHRLQFDPPQARLRRHQMTV